MPVSKKQNFFFIVSAKFKVVLMVFVAVCHTLDNDHVKGNFILFAMSIEVMAILWGKRRKSTLIGPQLLPFQQKNIIFFSFFGHVQNRSDGVCVVLPST